MTSSWHRHADYPAFRYSSVTPLSFLRYDQMIRGVSRRRLTIVLGKYAQAYHLNAGKASVTDIVRRWETFWPTQLPLPHPSPHNRIWVQRNPWFETEVLPVLRQRVGELI